MSWICCSRCAMKIWWLDAGALERRGDSARGAGRVSREHRRKGAGLGCDAEESPAARRCVGATAAPRFCRSKRWARTATQRLFGERRKGHGARDGALSRRGGRAGDRHHDSHAHRIGSVRHQYGAGEGEHRQLRGRNPDAIEFAFRCELCPGEYTITAASHDADGTAHDWLDDAVAISVTDSRYTAGVANLRANPQNSYRRGCERAAEEYRERNDPQAQRIRCHAVQERWKPRLYFLARCNPRRPAKNRIQCFRRHSPAALNGSGREPGRQEIGISTESERDLAAYLALRNPA